MAKAATTSVLSPLSPLCPHRVARSLIDGGGCTELMRAAYLGDTAKVPEEKDFACFLSFLFLFCVLFVLRFGFMFPQNQTCLGPA